MDGGEEAARVLRDGGSRGDCQMVLMDWDDPNTGGVSAVEEIRKVLPRTVPVLLMTALGGDSRDSMEEALKLECTGVLEKPFFLSALKDKVTEIRAEAAGNSQEPESAGAEGLEGLHFLAAEDNDINAEILTEILTLEGASCVIAGNGQLVLERFEQSDEGEFDAILMDVQMPVMNGYDATRAIRALEREDAARIPIIAMTANAFAEDEREALSAGMDVHLAKPIDIDMLKRVVPVSYTHLRAHET